MIASYEFASPELPEQYLDNIVRMKQTLRKKIGDVDSLFAEVVDFIEIETASIRDQEKELGSAWPVIDYSDVESGSVTQQDIDHIKRRGCLVIRNNFPRDQIIGWDKGLLEYLDRNQFDNFYRGPADTFFGSLEASRPEIFPIYWSRSQMELRQDPRMAKGQSFLNRLWDGNGHDGRWFDSDVNVIYPDRVRRRPPGTTSKGLGPHTDSGALERWLHPAYLQIFEKIYSGDFAGYNPWEAAHRTEVSEYAYKDTVKCSAFRTFQGWTALSDMKADQGVLHCVPIPKAMAYILLRPLLNDVPEQELCGVAPGKVLPVSEKWHPHLVAALSPIPDMQAGDSVWWHCDVIHSVAPVVDQKGWGNVMYVPAAPMCPKNLEYAAATYAAFKDGKSPADFPEEHYEQQWPDRFKKEDLNSIGKKGFGL